jgi:hypothetical protein
MKFSFFLHSFQLFKHPTRPFAALKPLNKSSHQLYNVRRSYSPMIQMETRARVLISIRLIQIKLISLGQESRHLSPETFSDEARLTRY